MVRWNFIVASHKVPSVALPTCHIICSDINQKSPMLTNFLKKNKGGKRGSYLFQTSNSQFGLKIYDKIAKFLHNKIHT